MTRVAHGRAWQWVERGLLAALVAVWTVWTDWTVPLSFGLSMGIADGMSGRPTRPAGIAGIAVAGWAVLLASALVPPHGGDVSRTFGGLTGLSPAAGTAIAAGLTLALAAALAWPGAVVGTFVGRWIRRGLGWDVTRADAARAAAAPGPVTLDPPGPPAAPSGAPFGTSAAAPP